MMLDSKFKEAIDFSEVNIDLPMKFKEAIIENVNYILANYYNFIDMIKIDIRAELCDVPEKVSSHVIFYTFENFKKSNKRLVKEIKKEGVILWKKN